MNSRPVTTVFGHERPEVRGTLVSTRAMKLALQELDADPICGSDNESLHIPTLLLLLRDLVLAKRPGPVSNDSSGSLATCPSLSMS